MSRVQQSPDRRQLPAILTISTPAFCQTGPTSDISRSINWNCLYPTCADSGSSDIRNPVFRVILGVNYTVRVVSEVLER